MKEKDVHCMENVDLSLSIHVVEHGSCETGQFPVVYHNSNLN